MAVTKIYVYSDIVVFVTFVWIVVIRWTKAGHQHRPSTKCSKGQRFFL